MRVSPVRARKSGWLAQGGCGARTAVTPTATRAAAQGTVDAHGACEHAHVGRAASRCLLAAHRPTLVCACATSRPKVARFDRRKGRGIRFRHAGHDGQVRLSVWGLVHAHRGLTLWAEHYLFAPFFFRSLFHRRRTCTVCSESSEDDAQVRLLVRCRRCIAQSTRTYTHRPSTAAPRTVCKQGTPSKLVRSVLQCGV